MQRARRAAAGSTRPRGSSIASSAVDHRRPTHLLLSDRLAARDDEPGARSPPARTRRDLGLQLLTIIDIARV
jgi:hypothetical protein